MKKSLKIAIPVLVVVSLAVLAFPLSNNLAKRQIEEPLGGVSEFKPVSVIMQNKCVDCHTKGKTIYPFYTNFPIAKKLIDEDVQLASDNMPFTREKLLGLQEFSRLDLSKIHTVVESGEMPPAQYKILHWDASLSDSDRKAFISWIEAETKSRKGQR
ncbi:MAG: heme-binding domain-containing protein [Candidatus Melainabacteria bacterium]|nr:MAG: heme-binding domain-containing protein [Candidatus Melainabacteria bacterium]